MADALRVLGVDPSLSTTGLAHIAGGRVQMAAIKTPAKTTGDRRNDWIANAFEETVTAWGGADVAVIEGLILGGRGAASGGLQERTGLFFILRRWLYRSGIPVVAVSPTSLKMYATGSGAAGRGLDAKKRKAVIEQAVRQTYPWLGEAGTDEIDAFVLAAMAADHYGHPLAVVDQQRRRALASPVWPVLDTTTQEDNR